MRRAITEAAAAGYAEVVFSGGEATLAGEALFQAMLHARHSGLAVRLVTNSHWAATAEAAERMLDDLAAAGVVHLTLSTGDEHARFVPLEHVLNAARASLSHGIGSSIVVEASATRVMNAESVKTHPQYMAFSEQFPSAEVEVSDWTWTPLSPYRHGQYAEGATADLSNLHARGRCAEVLSTTTLQADGTLSPCCGIAIRVASGLRLGSIREVDVASADAAAARNFLLRWLRAEGPERILAWAAAIDPTVQWEGLYAHPCQACMRVFKDSKIQRVVAERGSEKASEVEFLETLFVPAAVVGPVLSAEMATAHEANEAPEPPT